MSKKTKVNSAILILVFMFTLTLLPTYAMESTGSSGVSSDGLQTSDLSNSKLLDKSSVLKIAQYHIQSYLSTDIQTKGKEIVPSEEFINLYDLNNNLFAYLVPLLEKGTKEIGYITVGAIEDGYDSYEIFINDNAVSDIRAKMNEKKAISQKGADVKAKLVFIPPQYYAIKTEGEKEQYFSLSQNAKSGADDITSSIAAKNNDMSKYYKNIRSSENKKQIQKIIESPTLNAVNGVSAATVTAEDYRLVNEAEGQFVPVKDGSTTYYGGDQGWWPRGSDKENRGCGPTAAANITCYLARKNSSKYGKLYSPSSMSKNDFLYHMDILYLAINPAVFGETSLWDFASDVESYASSKGVSLSRVTSDKAFTLDYTADYIKNGLASDSPVATLNLQPPGTGYEYAWHWMTITKYFRDINDNRWIAVSTWGLRRSLNYRTHYDAMAHFPGGGIVYFN